MVLQRPTCSSSEAIVRRLLMNTAVLFTPVIYVNHKVFVHFIHIFLFYSLKAFPWITIIWADETDADFISVGRLCHIYPLWPAARLQQQQVASNKQENILNSFQLHSTFLQVFVRFLTGCVKVNKTERKKGVKVHRQSFLLEFLKIDYVVIWVSNNQVDAVIVCSCSPGQQLRLVL